MATFVGNEASESWHLHQPPKFSLPLPLNASFHNSLQAATQPGSYHPEIHTGTANKSIAAAATAATATATEISVSVTAAAAADGKGAY